MSQLIQLRRKIKSINKTRKITYAMRLTSMSLYSKLEKKNTPLVFYKNQIKSIFQDVYKNNQTWKNDILFPKDILNSSPLIVIVASSKGLCGGFNSNLIKFFNNTFLLEEHQKPSFITVGLKANKFANTEGLSPVIKHFDHFTSNTFTHIADDIIDIIHEKKFSSVTFFSNYFKNFFVQNPTQTQLIPMIEDLSTETNDNLILEQDADDIMNFLMLKYLRSSILHLLFQSIVSEQASRFLAMDTATSNADKSIDTLTLKYNKARQSLITKELAELTASFGRSD